MELISKQKAIEEIENKYCAQCSVYYQKSQCNGCEYGWTEVLKMRMIDADALLKKVYEHTQERERMTDGEWCRKCIYEAPTIEAEPVKHGRWILIGRCRITKSRDLKCSVCGNYFRVYDDITLNAGRGDANFCPNCGARMDEQPEIKPIPYNPAHRGAVTAEQFEAIWNDESEVQDDDEP